MPKKSLNKMIVSWLVKVHSDTEGNTWKYVTVGSLAYKKIHLRFISLLFINLKKMNVKTSMCVRSGVYSFMVKKGFAYSVNEVCL